MVVAVQCSYLSRLKSYFDKHQLFIVGHDLSINSVFDLFPGYVVVFDKIIRRRIGVHEGSFYFPSRESRATWANGIGNNGFELGTVTLLPANRADWIRPSRMRSYLRWPSIQSSQARSFSRAVTKSSGPGVFEKFN